MTAKTTCPSGDACLGAHECSGDGCRRQELQALGHESAGIVPPSTQKFSPPPKAPE